ncbi:unnamed protein product (mitochondrion) [Plasmodiophora brassicae]|uniref:G-protein coupled receptors family 3 profile domain-containing protein n=1 Tax=Plasmodiophora brassicae TaxID=37360 RepID=A0A0G4IXF1_PLABS|nr:hypothetical protein PBRA_007523 [Plasmodiophora brassicae]SPQ97043.1 unnamed protein product [Plasmodiophora brassicae]
MVATATVLAIRSRHIAMLMYNESAQMAVCTYNIMLVTALTIPVMALTSGNVTTLLVIRTVATAIVVLGSVSLFAQKLWIIAFYSPEDVDKLAKQRTVPNDKFTTNTGKGKAPTPI